MNELAFAKFCTFEKIDHVNRVVTGVFTSEALDSQDEIVAYDGIVKAVEEYKKWMNIREMHQASAVGIGLEIRTDSVARKAMIDVRIVDDNAWKKVAAGVYKGFSIGGKILKEGRRFIDQLNKTVRVIEEILLLEISVVDRPANPDATFSVFKRNQGSGMEVTTLAENEETTKAAGAQTSPPTDNAVKSTEADLQKAELVTKVADLAKKHDELKAEFVKRFEALEKSMAENKAEDEMASKFAAALEKALESKALVEKTKSKEDALKEKIKKTSTGELFMNVMSATPATPTEADSDEDQEGD